MADDHQQSHLTTLPTLANPEQLRIGIVYGQWHQKITDRLIHGARSMLDQVGVVEENIFMTAVPGSYEIPLAAKILMGEHKLDAVITLGCVIKGQTDHDVYINQAVAHGLMQLGLVSGVPCIFGVLTVNTEEQAIARSDVHAQGNKGAHAATAALQMIALKQKSNDHQPIGFNR